MTYLCRHLKRDGWLRIPCERTAIRVWVAKDGQVHPRCDAHVHEGHLESVWHGWTVEEAAQEVAA